MIGRRTRGPAFQEWDPTFNVQSNPYYEYFNYSGKGTPGDRHHFGIRVRTDWQSRRLERYNDGHDFLEGKGKGCSPEPSPGTRSRHFSTCKGKRKGTYIYSHSYGELGKGQKQGQVDAPWRPSPYSSR